jgi:hypothetical protein
MRNLFGFFAFWPVLGHPNHVIEIWCLGAVFSSESGPLIQYIPDLAAI